MSPPGSPSRATGMAGSIVAALLALGVAGCVTLLPKAPPVQLYRFAWHEPAAVPATAPATGAASTTIAALITSFQPAAANDRLLSVTGSEAADIAGARWVSPAVSLFQTALDQALDGRGGRLSRVSHGEPATADLRLSIEVERFEVEYDQGAGAAPAVRIEAHAALDRPGTPAARRERGFAVVVRASDNRVAAIVHAYDEAVSQTLDQLVVWAGTS